MYQRTASNDNQQNLNTAMNTSYLPSDLLIIYRKNIIRYQWSIMFMIQKAVIRMLSLRYNIPDLFQSKMCNRGVVQESVVGRRENWLLIVFCPMEFMTC